MGVKIAVIGGGSTYTPELIEGLVSRSDRLPVRELVLHDIAAERLDVVGSLARRMLQRAGWPGELTLTDDLDTAITEADFVLIQLRVGGQAARLVDETLPPGFGTIGQETTGAGGFAKALRTVPVVLGLAERVAERAAPGAWIVDFTNPVGIVMQALLDDGYRAIGLCNVAIGVQRQFARRFGVEPERIGLEHTGLNHLSWERAIRLDGTDVLPGLLDGDGTSLAADAGMPVEILQRLRAIPSYYLRYYYLFDEMLRHQREERTRAEEVMEIESRLLDLYRDPNLTEKPALLADRGGAFYSEAAAQLLASLHDDAGDVQVVNLRNDGALHELPDDDVIEAPARIGTIGAERIEQEPMADEIRDLVVRVKRYERLAVRAARSGDRAEALEALASNPLVDGHADPEPLLDALLEANRAHLPAFFGAAPA